MPKPSANRTPKRKPRLSGKLGIALPRRGSSAKLRATPLGVAIAYYVANRNCAPVSKSSLLSTLNANLADWMNIPILRIDTTMLQERYRAVIERIRAEGNELEVRYAKLPPEERLLRAPAGYFNGIKAANDTVRGFGRVYRYWVAKHSHKLHHAGIILPPCPTLALMDDVVPEAQRVKSIQWRDLRKLIDNFPTYKGNPLHPLLIRLLLASGRRVGALISCRKDYIHSGDERIVIPADAERTKVPWRKRHLQHLAQVIPITPEIAEILCELERVGPLHGDADTWLFPSREAKSGHMQEERNVVKGLRRHSGIRFNLHQLRHNVATAAEELGYSKAEIAELLGHSAQTVTDRYIDERTKRHRQQLIAVSGKIRELMGYTSTDPQDCRRAVAPVAPTATAQSADLAEAASSAVAATDGFFEVRDEDSCLDFMAGRYYSRGGHLQALWDRPSG
jgi:integrase